MSTMSRRVSPSHRRAWLLACALMVLACGREDAPAEVGAQGAGAEVAAPSKAPAPEELATPKADAAPEEAAASGEAPEDEDEGTPGVETPEEPPPEPLRFWVANEGLRAYDLDGKRVASVSKWGEHARRLADGRVVVFGPKKAGNQLVVLSAQGKVQRRVALPVGFDASCAAISTMPTGDDVEDGEVVEDWVEPVSVQERGGFALDATGTYACLELLDRNINMADVGLKVAVELGSGGVQTRIELDMEETCEGKGDALPGACEKVELGAPWIEGTPAPAPASSGAQTWDFALDDDDHWLLEGGERVRRLCDEEDSSCAVLESASPSGRWLLLTGRESEGDYIHLDLLLLDLSSGQLWELREGKRGRKRFVKVSVAEALGESAEIVVSMVGESDVAWLPRDRLWIDGLLVIPDEKKVVWIGGSRVFTQ
ncbi:hypothetical protein G6O69_20480 [Pseudenhygromyxa sp. WMMC2535]|uniref:hypothetical protein n=1 Tax=Pseudenhygromyxa sp. WMMC2535 TaxID=2712867 RepID=UPI0015952905|nr:hypothetical protein [Pseudenhygromyxa sp. WMMC2535]NVB40231.1 hypothetical protein [Pseudenhygromyxa sp. WMMC2535]